MIEIYFLLKISPVKTVIEIKHITVLVVCSNIVVLVHRQQHIFNGVLMNARVAWCLMNVNTIIYFKHFVIRYNYASDQSKQVPVSISSQHFFKESFMQMHSNKCKCNDVFERSTMGDRIWFISSHTLDNCS